MDGHGSSFEAVTNKEQMNKQFTQKIIKCKHHGSASRITQAADLSNCLKNTKVFNKSTTSIESPNIGLKGRITKIL